MLSPCTRALAALGLASGWLAAGAPGAFATPVTVNLRVEGQNATLFEGPITTDAYPGPPGPGIPAKDSGSATVGAHPCDFKDNGSNGGYGSSLATPTTALYDATRRLGVTFGATWYSSFDDFLITSVGSDTGAGGWGFAVDNTTSSAGGCQFGLGAGNDVLWAAGYFAKSHLLALSGPASADVGQPVTVTVTDGSTGAGFSGAGVGSAGTDAHGNPLVSYAPATDSHGNARVTFTHTGPQLIKAFHNADSVRSNRLEVCVHAGNDGTCGTSASGPTTSALTTPSTKSPTPRPRGARVRLKVPVGRILAITDGRVFHGRGPDTLRGAVTPDVAGTREVRLRVERQLGHRCQAYEGHRRRLVAIRCGAKNAPWFSVGSGRRFVLALGFALPRGRYVLDVQAVDRVGRRDDRLQRGRNRVTFRVI